MPFGMVSDGGPLIDRSQRRLKMLFAGRTRRERLAALLGRTGRSLTPLWPSGLAEFDGLRVDAIADG
jgi:hypothetical protein